MQVPAGAQSGTAPAALPPSAASSFVGWRPARWEPGTWHRVEVTRSREDETEQGR